MSSVASRSLRHLLFSLIISLPAVGQQPAPPIQLQFKGQYIVPHNKSFRNTIIGGLSGIDYDSKENVFYVICDDRSAINPARFYKARLHFSAKGIDSVEFLDVHTLLQKNGTPFPASTVDPALTPDPESIRLIAAKNQFIWASEGERMIDKKDTVLVNPAITLMDSNGRTLEQWPVPNALAMTTSDFGSRRNGALEALAFTNDGKELYAAMEEPLYQDSHRANTTPGDYWVRFLKYNATTRQVMSQFVYPLESVAFQAVPPTAFKINGISEILAWDHDRLLVIERSFSTGRLACTVKLFLADVRGASDVNAVTSLKEHRPAQLMKKELVLNLDDLGIYIDNVEGITWGPDFPNGHRSLILVADNNFLAVEKTQFFVFEVMSGK